MSALAGLLMVDRGLIELDAPVARYWPEFAQGGKAAVTVRDAFSHQTGAPGWSPPIAFDDFCNWDTATARHAAEPNWFAPGKSAPITARRLACRSALSRAASTGAPCPNCFARSSPSEPARTSASGSGRSPSSTHVATIKPPGPPPPLPPGSVLEKLLRSIEGFQPDSWSFQSAEGPAGGGLGNARSIARLCAIVAMGGELDGVRYLSADILEEAVREQSFGECPYLGWARFGLGFGMNSIGFRYPSPTTVGWGGFGGSWAIMDPKAGVSLGYVPNDFSIKPDGVIDPRQRPIARALYKLLPEL